MGTDDDFWLTRGGLTQQAQAFDQCADFLSSAQTYWQDKDVSDAGSHHLYQAAADDAQAIQAAIVTYLGHVCEVLRGVAVELRAVDTEAQGIEMSTLAALDAYDPVEYNDHDPGAPGRRSAAEIAPSVDRTDDLIFPVYPLNGGGIYYYLNPGSMFDYVTERETNLIPGDLLSPSEWLWTVFGWVGAQSLKDTVKEIFGGVWVDLYKFQYDLAGTATMLTHIKENLDSAIGALSVYWQGYSANSAQAYFADLVSKLEDAASDLSDAAESFTLFLNGVDAEFEALSGALHGFIDAAFVAAAAFGAATVAVPTVIGEPVAIGGGIVGGISLWVCAARLADAYEVITTISDVLTYLEALIGLTEDLTAQTQDLKIPAMEET